MDSDPAQEGISPLPPQPRKALQVDPKTNPEANIPFSNMTQGESSLW